MNKQDWLDYFEAVNGRSATEEEVAQALQAGEFEVESPAQAAPGAAVLPPTSEENLDAGLQEQAPAQAAVQEQTEQSAQAQTLQNQQPEATYQEQVTEPVAPAQEAVNSQDLNQGEQGQFSQGQAGPQTQQGFAGNQGQASPQAQEPFTGAQNQQQFTGPQGQGPFPGQQTQQQSQPAQPSPFVIMMKEFWAWLLSAWKSPTSEVQTNKHNGLLAFGFLTFFFATSFYSTLFQAGNSLLGAVSFGYYQMSFDFRVFFMIILASGLFFFSLIFAGFVVKRGIYKDESFTFLKSFEWYGRLFSISLLFSAAAALFSLLRILPLALLLLWASLFLIFVGATFALVFSRNNSKLDPFYKYLLAIVVNAVILFVFGLIEMALLAGLSM